MVIEPGNNINTHGAAAGKTRNQAPAKPSVSADNAPSTADKPEVDSVSLSSASLSIAKIESKLADASDVDAAKVSRIREEIASGKYQIDPQAIAEKIVSEDSQAL